MPEGGNVGIGTATPQRLLDVYGSGTGIARISGGSLGQPARRAILELSSGDSNRAQGILTISSGEENWFYGAGYGMNGAFTVGYGPTQPEYTAQSRLFITTLGNVGIGTTNPTQKLSVNGTVRAKEVIVDSGWSDYVFDESYKLKALSETEAFIKVEKHLPGIPSAQEVAEHGVNVGAMQAKLLAKIEELTLHVIEQEKRIERLETENHRLRLLIQPPLAP
jgi:hypothetical protein